MRSWLIIAVATAAALLLVLQVRPFSGGGEAAGAGDGSDVPPGLTRVTHIFFADRAAERIVEHGQGKVPPLPQTGSACPAGGGTDQCTTNSWSGAKWFSHPVEWSLNLQNADTTSTALDSEDAFEAALLAASNTWEDDAGSNFDATYLGRTSQDASSFRNGPSFRRMDGSNVVDFGNLSGQSSGAIAAVVYWYFTSTGEIVEADMRLNASYAWTANSDVAGDPDTSAGNLCCFDVGNIGTHEFGHFHAGLIDIDGADESELTMYAFGSLGELKKRTLGLGDQLSIASAYPLDGATPVPTSTPTDTPVPAATPTDAPLPTATSSPSPTATSTGGITLTAVGYKYRGLQKADLGWSGASSATVDVYRDGSLIATTANDGSYTDNIDQRGQGAYTYQVCEAGTATCSDQAAVNFG